ncbi:MAG TPA: alpha-amylase family glycosyl hydrolase [Puia sp.]|nr:alpha-amylase family glycosyl hydrolase [Puia sp.]
MRKQDIHKRLLARVLFFVVYLAGLTVSAKGQLLAESPSFPQDTSGLSITVDCSKGNQGLFNYTSTGDIYVHIGVITNLSTGSSDWKYVPFTWGTTDPLARAVYLGNNKYQYTIPHIRSFFNVPAGETILKMAVLFRNGSGSQVQRNADGSDMYLPVYNNALAARFLLPPFQPYYTPVPEPVQKSIDDTLPVKFMVNKPAALSLYFNGAQVLTTGSADSLQTVLTITGSGNQQVIATANDGINSLADTISFFVAGAVNTAPLPSGVKEGINYPPGDTSAILAFYAPHKNKIVVTGDFNNWTQQTAYQMNRTPDSNYYWLTIRGLTPGVEYAYQYVVDDTLVVADYNTEKVLDRNVDPSIPTAIYQGLKPFPVKAGGTLVSIIQTAKPAYAWQVNSFQRPDKRRLVIYELLVRDFISPADWQSLRDTLGYLKRLGVNAVEVMPFNNFEGASSWGYNPNFYFAPDKVYGTETALKQFIDACHQQGMAVIMDMVLNHSFGSSPMVQLYFDNAKGVPAANNPWFNQYTTHAYNVGYQFNHESPATKTFTQRVLAHWLNNYHIDGYRFDLAKGFTQRRTCDAMGNNCDVNAWGAYDASRVAIWDTIYQQLQVISPDSYCILEMFADNSEQKVESDHGMMLWGNMNYNFNQATMGYSDGWDLSGGLYSTLGWNQPGLVVYQESHDEERLMYKNEQYGNSNGSYNVRDKATGLRRNAMATVFWALLPGPKMLWEFGELGFDYSINRCGDGTVDAGGNCRTDPKPSGLSFLTDTSRIKLHDVYAAMLKLRASYPGLATPSAISSSLDGAFKTLQVSTDSLRVMAMGNFDVMPANGHVVFPVTGTWYDYFTGQPFPASGGVQYFTLSPGEYRVYVSRNLANVAAGGNGNSGSNPFDMKIYPNPVVNGSAILEYQLPEEGPTSVLVANMMGQTLGSADLGSQAAGPHTLRLAQLSLPLPSLANGYYVLKLVSQGRSSRSTFMIIHP